MNVRRVILAVTILAVAVAVAWGLAVRQERKQLMDAERLLGKSEDEVRTTLGDHYDLVEETPTKQPCLMWNYSGQYHDNDGRAVDVMLVFKEGRVVRVFILPASIISPTAQRRRPRRR